MLVAKFGKCIKSLPDDIVFKGLKGSWRAAEARHCERPGEFVGEDTALAAVEDPGLKDACKEVES